MKKLYSIVLMATALLVGTNVKAVNVSDWAGLKTAMQAGGEVVLSADIEAANIGATDCIWIGAEEENGTAPNVILNLAGHSITITPSVNSINPFVLSKGSLEIVSATPAKIELTEGTKVLNKSNNVFTVFGASANQKQDPKTNPFSHLVIGENVTIQTQNGTVIAIDALTAAQGAVANLPTPKPTYATTHYAYGACVDVKGTLISQGAKTTADEQKCYGVKVNGNVDLIPADADKPYAPYVHIHPSAVITTDYTFAKSAACYASGYAQWLIEGNCSGASGVYATKGSVTINNATVKSGAATYTPPTGAGGANGAGSAIVINSRGGTYDGTVEVTVSGDTKAESTAGYAMEEIINTTDHETNVSQINITGGTFEGGSAGAIVVTTGTVENADVKVEGGNVSGSANVGTETLADYLNDKGGTHATLVDDGSGHTILVISEGDAPTGAADFNSDATASVKWTGATKEITGTFALKELEASEATAQTLTIKNNATFTVERVVLGANAKIIVEAGGKFIVTGNQGIVAPVVDNIVLKTEEGNPAIFLFHPSVTSNRHPMATVEFTSKSCYRYPAQKNIYQRFGIPMKKDGLVSIEAQDNHETRFFAYDYVNAHDWVGIGYINPSPGYESQALDITKMNDPFEYYQLLDFVATTPTPGVIYTMKGNLLGNGEPTMDIIENSWKGFANSYMGNMKLSELLKLIPNTVDKAIYVYDVNAKFASWEPVSNLNAANQILNPMQPFLIRNRYEAAAVELDYEETVYKPTLGIASSPAPRRAVAENITMAKISIANENSADYVIVAESDEFTPAFDNGYDASKFMNDEANLYVMAEENMSIFATDELENTYLGVSSVLGGKYTMTFSNVSGEEFVLVDNMTGIQTVIAEGNTYEFTADANSANDYRFEIVSPRKVTTAIENAEAVKNAKGIYTITGQYMGEMNVWNSLPAGVYVVNGEKRVK